MKTKISDKLRISQNEAESVLFGELFPALTKPKSRDRALSILEAAIECYRRVGIEATTYETIAEQAGISRPLIFKYFDDYDDIFYKSMKFIRVHFQLHAVEAIKAKSEPLEKLKAYVESTFDWIDNYPAFGSGLLLYLQRCSRSERERDLNTQFTEAGRQRIAALIRASADQTKFEVRDLDATAKRIQTVITGAIVTSLTEDLSDQKTYRDETLALCLGLIRVKALSR